jgi:hypothetical protein
MRIFKKVIWDMEALRIIESESYEYGGLIELVCGATKGQKDAAAQEASIASSLDSNFKKIFAGNESILSNITSSLTPIIEAGPGQYGYTGAEDAALRTQATATNAAASQQVTNAVRSAEAARGGGNTYIPSGAEAEIEGSLAQTEAQKQADAQLGITEKGYETGRQNFFQSTQDLAQAPGALENPAIAAGSTASGAAATSMQGQTDIANANNAWIAPVAGMIGAIGGAATGAATRHFLPPSK